jgi:hypothetical protein
MEQSLSNNPTHQPILHRPINTLLRQAAEGSGDSERLSSRGVAPVHSAVSVAPHAFEVGEEERERKRAGALNTLTQIHARAETARQRLCCCGDGAPAAGVLGCKTGSN